MIPRDIPLEQWTNGWLKFDVARKLDYPIYLVMHDHEKRQMGFPVTREEMIAFLKKDEKREDKI